MFDRKLVNLISIIALVLVLLTGWVWWSLQLERASLARSFPATPTSASSANLNSSIPYPEIPRIGLDTAKAAFDTERAVFVDARSASSYSEGHIPGALLMNEEDLSGFIRDLDLSTWIITYCT